MGITLKTIAEDVGASVATVSLALSDHPRVNAKTKQRIREASVRLGYCTPDDLRQRRNRKAAKGNAEPLNFLLFEICKPQKAVLEPLLTNMLRRRADQRMSLELISMAPSDDDEACEQIRSYADDLDGIIIYGRATRELLAGLASLDCPIVTVGPVVGPWPSLDLKARIAMVGFDEIMAARQATERLLALGHQRIALVRALGTPGLFYDRWEDGYRLAMSRAGIPLDRLIFDRSGGRDIGAGQVPHWLRGDEPPTAYICVDPSYLPMLRESAELAGHPATPANTIVVGTEYTLRSHGATGFPASMDHVGQLADACVDQLQTMQYAPPAPCRMITLPSTQTDMEQLRPPG